MVVCSLAECFLCETLSITALGLQTGCAIRRVIHTLVSTTSRLAETDPETKMISLVMQGMCCKCQASCAAVLKRIQIHLVWNI